MIIFTLFVCSLGAKRVLQTSATTGRRGVGRYQVGPDVVKPQLEMAIVPETPLPPQPPLGRGIRGIWNWWKISRYN